MYTNRQKSPTRTETFGSTVVWAVMFFVAFEKFVPVNSINHCTKHLYTPSTMTPYMQLTKEVISSEYAVLEKFKSIHCCAKGYRSIQWKKDGIPYPWSPEVSSLILYPERANQTIYTRQVQFSDVGNYTCVLKNDTHTLIKHISLQVQGSLPDAPLPTYRPRDLSVELNSPARLYCEAFVGKVELPDARTEISWHREMGPDQYTQVGRVSEVSRDNGQIIGSYLEIDSVHPEDYGRYFCQIQIGNDAAHRLKMYASLFGEPIAAEEDLSVWGILFGVVGFSICMFIVAIAFWCRHIRQKQNSCKNNLDYDYGQGRRV